MRKAIASKKIPSLSIAIPAYNEEETLSWVIQNILQNAKKYLSDFEIIIVNDGSKDKTGKIADVFARKYKNIRVIHQQNGGYGRAMFRGIHEAKKEFIAFMPADGQFILEDMRFCLPHVGGSDLILGSRGVRIDYSTYRLVLSYTYLLLLRILFGIRYRDVNWLTIWRTKQVQKLHIDSRSVFLLAEIVIRFKRKGLKIVEAPSFYRPRRAGKVKNVKLSVVYKTLIDTMWFWWKTRYEKH